MTAQQLLLDWLKARLEKPSILWLEEKAALLATGAPDRIVFTSFSAALRFSGKDLLNLSAQDLAKAETVVPDWKPSDWTRDQAARIFLLLSLPGNAGTAKVIDQIYHTADVGEAVALQKGLAVLPYPEGHMA